MISTHLLFSQWLQMTTVLEDISTNYTKSHLISTYVEISSPKEFSAIGTDFLRMLWRRPPSTHSRIDWTVGRLTGRHGQLKS